MHEAKRCGVRECTKRCLFQVASVPRDSKSRDTTILQKFYLCLGMRMHAYVYFEMSDNLIEMEQAMWKYNR